MKKVAVVGCGGSGKTYVARQLGAVLGVPVTHLDEVFYDRDWNELPCDQFTAAQRELVAAPAWVIDGNHNSTLEIRLRACDTVIFSDLPTLTALRGILARQARHGAGQHGNGIHNRLHWGVIRYVVTYRRRMRPQVLAKIQEHASHAQVIHLTSRRAIRRWLRAQAAAER